MRIRIHIHVHDYAEEHMPWHGNGNDSQDCNDCMCACLCGCVCTCLTSSMCVWVCMYVCCFDFRLTISVCWFSLLDRMNVEFRFRVSVTTNTVVDMRQINAVA